MKRLLPLVVMFIAAAQSGGAESGGIPAGFVAAQAPLPPEVEAAIPADLPISNVIVQDGCYYTFIGGTVAPVVTEAMRAAGFTNQPYCVG